jgi:hypothetical protein
LNARTAVKDVIAVVAVRTKHAPIRLLHKKQALFVIDEKLDVHDFCQLNHG